MQKSPSPPGFFQKRKMRENPATPAAELSRMGTAAAEQGLFDEALLFYARADDRERLEALLEQCRLEGDAFSFTAVLRVLGRTATKEEWDALGRTALERGQLWFAYRAFEKADDQEGLLGVRGAMVEQGVLVPE